MSRMAKYYKTAIVVLISVVGISNNHLIGYKVPSIRRKFFSDTLNLALFLQLIMPLAPREFTIATSLNLHDF